MRWARSKIKGPTIQRFPILAVRPHYYYCSFSTHFILSSTCSSCLPSSSSWWDEILALILYRRGNICSLFFYIGKATCRFNHHLAWIEIVRGSCEMENGAVNFHNKWLASLQTLVLHPVYAPLFVWKSTKIRLWVSSRKHVLDIAIKIVSFCASFDDAYLGIYESGVTRTLFTACARWDWRFLAWFESKVFIFMDMVMDSGSCAWNKINKRLSEFNLLFELHRSMKHANGSWIKPMMRRLRSFFPS